MWDRSLIAAFSRPTRAREPNKKSEAITTDAVLAVCIAFARLIRCI